MIYQARETFHTGDHRMIHRGELVSADDPVVRGKEHLFRRIDDESVEQATAAPGEKRSVRRPKRRRPSATSSSR